MITSKLWFFEKCLSECCKQKCAFVKEVYKIESCRVHHSHKKWKDSLEGSLD